MFLLQSTNNWSASMLSLLGQFFSVTLAIVFVIFLAYYATRWLAGARYLRSGKANLRLMEGVAVGQHASVQLVRAGDKYVLVGVTRERVTFLAEIPEEQLSIHEPELSVVPFEKYLKAYWKKDTDESDITEKE